MRHRLYLAAILAAAACEPSATEPRRGFLPPTLSVTATTRATPSVTGDPDLEVSAILRNETGEAIRVAIPPSCPLFVRLFLNPTGEARGELRGSTACSMAGPTLELAPGDTAVFTRLIGAAALATFVDGKYGVNVAVTTSTALIGVWGGAVDLPLSGSD